MTQATDIPPFGQKGAYVFHAPAKVNLYLHVTGKRADGYHLLDSLVVFTDLCDWVSLTPNTKTPSDASSSPPISSSSLSSPLCIIEGEHAQDLIDAQHEHPDNSVIRAARMMADYFSQNTDSLIFHLHKNIPIKAGLGGGSSDGATTIRALCHFWGTAYDQAIKTPALWEIARTLGADVPMCLYGKPARIRGIGEHIDPVSITPPLYILLANPRIPCSTRTIFQDFAFDPIKNEEDNASTIPPIWEDFESLIAFLQTTRNDLTHIAVRHVPVIHDVLQALNALPQAHCARMSGSGSTCFALFPSHTDLKQAKEILVKQNPKWWIQETRTITHEHYSKSSCAFTSDSNERSFIDKDLSHNS